MAFYSDDILQIIIAAAAGYAMFKAGVAYTLWRIQQDLIALENGEIEFEEEEQDPMGNAEFMSIEKQSGLFYAYGKDRRFLTQADSIKELFQNIKKDYPDTVWLIGNDNDTLSKEEQDQILPTLKSIFEDSK